MEISLTKSCNVFLSIIFVLVSPLDLTCGVAKFGIGIAISCTLDVLGCKTFDGGFSVFYIRDLLICVFILCPNPAPPCLNLVLSVILLLLLSLLVAHKPLSNPYTSSNFIKLDFT